MLDIDRLAKEMNLSCIQAIKMDALKSVRVEETQNLVSKGATEEATAVPNLNLEEPVDAVQKCSRKHLREGEYRLKLNFSSLLFGRF